MIDSGLSKGKAAASLNSDKFDQKQLPSLSTFITSLFGTLEASNTFSAFLASSTSICPRSDDIVQASVSDSSSYIEDILIEGGSSLESLRSFSLRSVIAIDVFW
jgi:hypothetical protein